eukprot:jgi/Mesvir1/2854/Mv13941-RA.1
MATALGNVRCIDNISALYSCSARHVPGPRHIGVAGSRSIFAGQRISLGKETLSSPLWPGEENTAKRSQTSCSLAGGAGAWALAGLACWSCVRHAVAPYIQAHDEAVAQLAVKEAATTSTGSHPARRNVLTSILAKYAPAFARTFTPATTMLAAIAVGPAWKGACMEISRNQAFVCAFYAWLIAQVLKVFTTAYKEGRLDFRVLVSSGGMPSSHSSLCMAITSCVAITQGLSSTLFAVCFAFSLIVMYDAAGVRLHAGKQAQVLNVIIAELLQFHPIKETQLKELLGHTPSQVFAGAFIGVLTAVLGCHYPHLLPGLRI